MARTALEEMWGGTLEFGVVNSGQLPLPSGVPGAARFIDNRGTTIELQDARLCPLGGPVYVVWNNPTATQNCSLKDATGTQLVLLTTDQVAKCYLMDNSTEAGTWLVITSNGSQSGALPTNYEEFTIQLGTQRSINRNLRTECDLLGYTGNNPARVHAFVGSESGLGQGVVGSELSGPALTTGTFPANSLVILTVRSDGFIAGRGGRGGIGQPILSVNPTTYGTITNAEDGQDGLHIECDTVLFNYGKIQGGGGGGNGGQASGLVSGPGGGGGAGHLPAAGGDAGSFPANSGCSTGGNGGRGTVDLAGIGGGGNIGTPAGNTGGDGGDAGLAGNASSGGISAGVGQPGYAIRVDTQVRLTKAVAGTIDGSEGTL